MRLTVITCQKKNCNNVVKTGFRFCGTCGKKVKKNE